MEKEESIKNKQILIFIHGGLNSFENSYERARKLVFCCKNRIPENIYPIIINWESGIGTAYTDYVFRIRQGDTFSKGQKVAWTFASPFIFLGDFVKGIVRMPYLTGYQIQNYTKTLPNRYELATEKMNEVLYENAGKTEGIKISKVEYEHGIDGKKVLEDLLVIPLVPFKLITNSIIDGAGKGAWETMARRTQTMFNSPEEFTEDARFFVPWSDKEEAKKEAKKEAEKRVIPRSTGALSKCMEKLSPVLKNPEGYEVNLIGHSMGTIVMNEILHRYRDFSFKHIVYMGAACSINDFRVNGIPYLIEHNNTEFYNLCLHPLAEQREDNYLIIPRGSLLEWLDNFLTSPNTTLDRRMGKWENIVRTSSVIPNEVIPNEVRGRVTLKAFELCKGKNNAQNEKECKECHHNSSQKPSKNPGNPQGHGEFTEQNFWEKDFWLLKKHAENKS